MIAPIVKAWEAGKAELRHKWTEKLPNGYAELVLDVVSVLSSHMEEHDKPDPERITAIDHGDYQGTLVFVIGGCGCQPYTYYVVKVDYGSCSQCDSFQAALDGGETVSDLMTLALHVVQDIQVIKKAREHEAELLAARARIAKLEQEPPMAMVDFGVGLDLQGIRDDLKFLDDVRRENQQLRADLREAMELLRAHGEPPNWLRQAWLRSEPGDDTTAFHTWNRRYGKLLAKHKETP